MMYTELKLNIGWLVLVLPFSSYQQQEGRHELGRSCEEEQLQYFFRQINPSRLTSNYRFFNSSNLNILYFNARSLPPKIDELRLICAATSPHIVCVVETWLGT